MSQNNHFATVQSIFKNHGYSIQFNQYRELSGNPFLLRDSIKPIFDDIFPRVCEPTVFRHYTKFDAAENILQGKLWLTSIEKRIHQNELEEFYAATNINGIFDEGSTGRKIKNEISRSMFYLSLTDENLNDQEDQHMKVEFDSEVLLYLRVECKNGNLRRVKYNNQKLDIFKELLGYDFCGKKLSFDGLNRIAAYLLNKYSEEKETRLLHYTTSTDNNGIIESPFLHFETGLDNPDIGYVIKVVGVSSENQGFNNKFDVRYI